MSHLPGGVLLLLRTESFRLLLSGITKSIYEGRNEISSCHRANGLSVKNKQTNFGYNVFIAIEYGKTLALFLTL